jgi:hypothetical protein
MVGPWGPTLKCLPYYGIEKSELNQIRDLRIVSPRGFSVQTQRAHSAASRLSPGSISAPSCRWQVPPVAGRGSHGAGRQFISYYLALLAARPLTSPAPPRT